MLLDAQRCMYVKRLPFVWSANGRGHPTGPGGGALKSGSNVPTHRVPSVPRHSRWLIPAQSAFCSQRYSGQLRVICFLEETGSHRAKRAPSKDKVEFCYERSSAFFWVVKPLVIPSVAFRIYIFGKLYFATSYLYSLQLELNTYSYVSPIYFRWPKILKPDSFKC